jgi:hypothetical protein
MQPKPPTVAQVPPGLDVCLVSQAAGEINQDCAGEFVCAGARILVLADGVGNSADGAESARRLLTWLQEDCEQGCIDLDPLVWVDRLLRFDAALCGGIQAGETAGVVAAVVGGTVVGASVGHASAWLIEGEGLVDLTERQYRRPLLGTSTAMPVGFGPLPLDGTLLLASDGLTAYAERGRIAEVARGEFLDLCVADLVALARLPSGDYFDDVSVVLCRTGAAVPAPGEAWSVDEVEAPEEIVLEGGIDGSREPA